MTNDSRDLFRRGLSNAPWWFTAAGDLFLAAKVLWEKLEPLTNVTDVDAAAAFEWDFRLIKPFDFLCGLAIENQLKALIIKRQFGRQDGAPEPGAPTELPRDLKSHDLVKLAETALLIAGVRNSACRYSRPTALPATMTAICFRRKRPRASSHHHIYVRMMIDGKPAKPFSAKVLSPLERN